MNHHLVAVLPLDLPPSVWCGDQKLRPLISVMLLATEPDALSSMGWRTQWESSAMLVPRKLLVLPVATDEQDADVEACRFWATDQAALLIDLSRTRMYLRPVVVSGISVEQLLESAVVAMRPDPGTDVTSDAITKMAGFCVHAFHELRTLARAMDGMSPEETAEA